MREHLLASLLRVTLGRAHVILQDSIHTVLHGLVQENPSYFLTQVRTCVLCVLSSLSHSSFLPLPLPWAIQKRLVVHSYMRLLTLGVHKNYQALQLHSLTSLLTCVTIRNLLIVNYVQHVTCHMSLLVLSQ